MTTPFAHEITCHTPLWFGKFKGRSLYDIYTGGRYVDVGDRWYIRWIAAQQPETKAFAALQEHARGLVKHLDATDRPTRRLTKNQADAKREVMSALQRNKSAVLHGYAGTGKTFLTASLVLDAIDDLDVQQIVFAAPTHRALEQLNLATKDLREFLKRAGYWPKSSTIYGKLRAVPKQLLLKNEQEDMRKNASMEDELHLYLSGIYDAEKFGFRTLVILDEASMVDGRLGSVLSKWNTAKPGRYLLLVGDPAQLKPVAGKPYAPFSEPTATLTQVVRHGGAILETATKIREGKPVVVEASDCGGIMVIPDLTQTYCELSKYTDSLAVGVYTNKRRIVRAQEIRASLNPDRDPLKIYPGEQFAVKNQVKLNIAVPAGMRPAVLHVETDITLETAKPIKLDVREKVVQTIIKSSKKPLEEDDVINNLGGYYSELPETFDAWEIGAAGYAGKAVVAALLTEDQQMFFDFFCKNNTVPQDLVVALQRVLPVISPACVKTIHCLQGSTYRYVLIDAQDLQGADSDTLRRLGYVGCTRASKKLILSAPLRINHRRTRKTVTWGSTSSAGSELGGFDWW